MMWLLGWLLKNEYILPGRLGRRYSRNWNPRSMRWGKHVLRTKKGIFLWYLLQESHQEPGAPGVHGTGRAFTTVHGPESTPDTCHWPALLGLPAASSSSCAPAPYWPNSQHQDSVLWNTHGEILPPQKYTSVGGAPAAASAPATGSSPCCWPWPSLLTVVPLPPHRHLLSLWDREQEKGAHAHHSFST